MSDGENQKPKSIKGMIGLAILIALVIAIGVWGYLIKTNKFFGLGELLRPSLKEIPIVNLILPELPDASDPIMLDRETLNQKYRDLLAENVNLHIEITQYGNLEKEKKETDNKYKILLKEVETLTNQLNDAKKVQSVEATNVSGEEKIKNLVKIYESMETSEAASILQEVGELNISLVVDICTAMKSTKLAEIMQEMDTDFAAILSERMVK